MTAPALTDRVREAVGDPDEFDARVAEEAETLTEELRDGAFDNHQSIVGLEYEFYGVDEDAALVRVPRRLLELIGFEKELGLHNAEMTTSPQPLSSHGLAAQEAEVRANLDAALTASSPHGIRLVSDAMWTIPPTGETATEYLTDSIAEDGVRIAANMSDSPRYHAMATNVTYSPRMEIDAPHVSLRAETVMPEALITSIQPHYQVASPEDLPEYFRYALRIAGPLLALGVNSPVFPADLYDDGTDAETALADGWDEHRIAVFETVLNPTDGDPKVTFPHDFDTVEDAVDRIAEDTTVVPTLFEDDGSRYDDRFSHLRHKHGTFWRWVRPVFDGSSRTAANARIEFRPIAAQPTVRDSVAFLAAFAGLLEGLYHVEHPVRGLDWKTAEENFYAAMRDGIDAELTWLTSNGEETTDRDALYDELFDVARYGLRQRGFAEPEAREYLAPLARRARDGYTPARWKRGRIRRALSEGAEFDEAIATMQREYVDRQAETLIDGAFTEWYSDGDRA